jgi:CBS domain containing-hemolysin-like protein
MISEHALWWTLAIGGTVLAGLAAGAEMGAYSVNKVRLSILSAPPLPGAPESTRYRLARILSGELERPARLLATILIAYNLFSSAAALGTTELLIAGGYSEGQIILLNTLLIGPILFVIADTMPKELFRALADRLMYAMAPALRLVRILLTLSGVLPLVQVVASLAERMIPTRTIDKGAAATDVVTESQVTLLDRAFGLRSTRVADEMVPWAACITLPENADRTRILATLSAHTCSRFPVIATKGHAAGTPIGTVDFLEFIADPDAPLASRIRPTVHLAPDMPVREALVTMKTAGVRLAIVSDKGKPVGIVTAKDLVEPLIGELHAW